MVVVVVGLVVEVVGIVVVVNTLHAPRLHAYPLGHGRDDMTLRLFSQYPSLTYDDPTHESVTHLFGGQSGEFAYAAEQNNG
jgi:hypothetical protein